MYTYSRDLENGLCDRHKKAEVVHLSEFQKKDTNTNGSYKGETWSTASKCNQFLFQILLTTATRVLTWSTMTLIFMRTDFSQEAILVTSTDPACYIMVSRQTCLILKNKLCTCLYRLSNILTLHTIKRIIFRSSEFHMSSSWTQFKCYTNTI